MKRRRLALGLGKLFGVIAGFLFGLFVAGLATEQIDRQVDTLVAFIVFIAIPAILAAVSFALAGKASKELAGGSQLGAAPR